MAVLEKSSLAILITIVSFDKLINGTGEYFARFFANKHYFFYTLWVKTTGAKFLDTANFPAVQGHT